MRLSHVRVLLLSLGIGALLGLGGGALWSVITDAAFWHGVGTGLVIVGIIAFGVGAIGATEPPEGWATSRRKESRRSALRLATEEHPRLRQGSSFDLAVWGIVVGGGLIGLAMLAFGQAT